MDKNGKNLDDLQDLNRAYIIRHLAMHEGCSRTDLANATGLRQASITKIMHSLVEAGVVVETGFTEGLKGRRSIGLSLNYPKFLVIGIKIAWERLSIGVFDFKGNVHGSIFSNSFSYLDEANADRLIDLAAETVANFRRQFPNIIAVGVAVPGPFHRGDGSVYIAVDGTEGKMYYPFLDKLKQRISLPVAMDHDANAGALGYWWFRTNCDTRIALMYLLASEGVGGGVVSKGQIITGQRGHSAEFGHINIELGGRECVCGGHGCLDAYASSIAVEKQARALMARYKNSVLTGRRLPSIEAIFAALRKNDKLATRLVHDAGKYMGCAFASLIPIFDPDIIVIGDLMAGGGATLLAGIDESLGKILSPFYKKPQIVLADPADDLVLLGSATIAIDHAFKRPTELLMPAEPDAAGL